MANLTKEIVVPQFDHQPAQQVNAQVSNLIKYVSYFVRISDGQVENINEFKKRNE